MTTQECIDSLSPENQKRVADLAKWHAEDDPTLTAEQVQGEAYQTFYEQQCEARSPEAQDYRDYMEEGY